MGSPKKLRARMSVAHQFPITNTVFIPDILLTMPNLIKM
jgi:hypothetical protein